MSKYGQSRFVDDDDQEDEQPLTVAQTGQAFYPDQGQGYEVPVDPYEQVRQMVAEERDALLHAQAIADRNATYQQELEAAEQAQDEGGEEFVPADGLGQLYDANPYDPDGILPTSNQIKALSFAEREALERAHPGIIEQVIQASQWRWRNEEDGGRTNARATAEAERLEQTAEFQQDGEAQLDAARKAYLDNFDRMTHWQRALRGAQLGFAPEVWS